MNVALATVAGPARTAERGQSEKSPAQASGSSGDELQLAPSLSQLVSQQQQPAAKCAMATSLGWRHRDAAPVPQRGLASLVAMLQSQQGLEAAALAAGLSSPSGLKQQLAARQGFGGIGMVAAAAAAGEDGRSSGARRSPSSHAVSPAPTSWQPMSPQL